MPNRRGPRPIGRPTPVTRPDKGATGSRPLRPNAPAPPQPQPRRAATFDSSAKVLLHVTNLGLFLDGTIFSIHSVSTLASPGYSMRGQGILRRSPAAKVKLR